MRDRAWRTSVNNNIGQMEETTLLLEVIRLFKAPQANE